MVASVADLIPDIPQPIVGYKVFPTEGRKLVRGWGDEPWPIGRPMQARCRRIYRKGCGETPSPIDSPVHHDGHGCGLYAYRDFETLATWNYSDSIVVVEVSLWGKVYEYADGYRGEMGQITGVRELWTDDGRAQRTAELYNVPLLMFPLPPARCDELRADGDRRRRNQYRRMTRAARAL